MTGLYWDADQVRVKSFAASSGKAGTTLKVELVVSDPFRLAMLLEALAEAQRNQAIAARSPYRPVDKSVEERAAGRARRDQAGIRQMSPLLLTDGRGRG